MQLKYYIKFNFKVVYVNKIYLIQEGQIYSYEHKIITTSSKFRCDCELDYINALSGSKLSRGGSSLKLPSQEM